MREYTVTVTRYRVANEVQAAEWRGRAGGPGEARQLARHGGDALAWAPVGDPYVGDWVYLDELGEVVPVGESDA